MLFNSFQFALFFSAIVAVHFFTPGRWRWLILLIGSYFFYACWCWEYLFLLLGVTVVHWFCARRIGARGERWVQRLYLGAYRFRPYRFRPRPNRQNIARNYRFSPRPNR